MYKKIGNKEYSTMADFEVKDLADLLDLSASTIYHHLTCGHLAYDISIVTNRYNIKGSRVYRFVKKYYPEKLQVNKE